jgi:hypothetical protein
MADLVIRLSVEKNGALTQSPSPARVNGGDIVFWITDSGSLSVMFERGKNPFVGSGAFRAGKGQPTSAGKVRANVPVPKSFDCTIKIGRQVFRNASGVDTPGSGRM